MEEDFRGNEASCCYVTGPKVENDGSRNAERRTENGARRLQNVMCASPSPSDSPGSSTTSSVIAITSCVGGGGAETRHQHS